MKRLAPNERMSPYQLQSELIEVLTPPGPDDDLNLAYDFFGTSGVFFAERDEYPESVEDLTPEQLHDYAKWLRKTGINLEIQDAPFEVPPRYYFTDLKRLPEGTWLLHHTDTTFEKFDRGSELRGLHLSTWSRTKAMARALNLDDEISAYERVYAFAFEVDNDPTVGRDGAPKATRRKYGKYILAFQCDSAVSAWHEGDNEEQAIFTVGAEYNLRFIWIDEYSDRWAIGDEWNVSEDEDSLYFDSIYDLTKFLEERADA